MEHFQNNDIRRIIAFLDEEIRSRGYGEIRQVDRAVGRKPGWWQNRVAAGSISGRDLLRVLDYLGLQPGKTIRRALGREDELELDRPRGKVPEVVLRARTRESLGRVADCLGIALIDTLDEQRSQDPKKVVEIASWAIDHVDLKLLPRLLGVLGSAYGLQFLLDEAEHCFYAGIEIARARDGDSPVVASLLTRLSYAVSNRGDRKTALRLAERAAWLSLRSNDSDGFGRALLAQGSWLYYLDRPEEAIAILRTAQDHLSVRSQSSRFAAFQAAGVACQRIGDLQGALQYFEAAQEVLPNNDWDKGKLLWLRARIHVDLEDFETASTLLEEVVGIFSKLHLGEVALATCELVRAQLHRGQGNLAFRTASSMRALLEPLRYNKIISAAIADLIRSRQKGLTLALVENAIQQIESERHRRSEWMALRSSRSSNT